MVLPNRGTDNNYSHAIRRSQRKREIFRPYILLWFGKPVVMLVVIRQCHIPMPCQIVGESAADARVRIKPGWEMNVGKELIPAVEEVVSAAEEWIH